MPTYRRVQDVEHEIGAAGAFSLAVTSANVQLVASDGPLARVRATFEINASTDAEADGVFEAARLRVRAEGGSLRVDEPGGRGGFGGIVSRLLGDRSALESVEAEAPAGCRLDVQVVSSDVQATGFRRTQRYQAVSGDLRLAEAGGELDIDSVSGDVSLRAVGTVSLKVNSVSGDVSAMAPAFERVQAQSVSGDVSIDGDLGTSEPHAVETVSGDFRLASGSGMTVSVRGMSTDVSSALPHRVEGSAEHRRLIVGDGRARVAFNSMSGDLAVTRSRQSPAPVPAATPETRLDVLGAVERGEISVDEALRRLGDAS